MPIVESSYIVDMNKQRIERPDHRLSAWEQSGNSRASLALTDYPLESRSRRGSRQILDAEKLSIMSAKARGKKPEILGEDTKDSPPPPGDTDVVSSPEFFI